MRLRSFLIAPKNDQNASGVEFTILASDSDYQLGEIGGLRAHEVRRRIWALLHDNRRDWNIGLSDIILTKETSGAYRLRAKCPGFSALWGGF